jgi:hypothetical protein
VSRVVVGALVALLGVALVGGCGAEASPSSSPASWTGVTIDPGLLRHLPDEIDGLPLIRSDEGVAEAAADPAVGTGVVAIAAGLVVDPERGDFAFVALMRLRDGAMSEAFYTDWRDTFDDGACAQAGGLAAQAEVVIGGREAFSGICSGGMRTYHAWLGNPGLLVSVSTLGERRLGERLVESLTD